MQDFPRISIVTPSYNQGHFLEQTIQSVLSQGYPNLEYIIIDGASTDGSLDIIKRYENRLAYWCSEKDRGHYDAVNKGFSKSTGEILGWINSDDIYFPWTLFSVAEIMAQLPEVDWLSTLFAAGVDYHGRLCGLLPLPGFSKEAFLEGKNLPGEDTLTVPFGYLQQESTFWRRGLWEKVGGIRTEYKLAGDFDLWARFFQHADLWGCPIPLAGFRIQYQQRSANAAEYYSDARDSLVDMRKTMKWSKAWWRAVLDFFGLSRLRLIRGPIKMMNYYFGPRKYRGLQLSRERRGYPDAHWVSIKHRF
jgi:glycosyltransferase involved in cell wall biosynthesis